jgi:hypothetical protein
MDDEGRWPNWITYSGSALLWSFVAAVVLFAAGLAGRSLMAIAHREAVDFGGGFLGALSWFAIGGGVTIGVMIYAWQIARRDPLGKVVALVVLLLIGFGVVVWPSPWKYYASDDNKTVLRVNRITGELKPGEPRP